MCASRDQAGREGRRERFEAEAERKKKLVQENPAPASSCGSGRSERHLVVEVKRDDREAPATPLGGDQAGGRQAVERVEGCVIGDGEAGAQLGAEGEGTGTRGGGLDAQRQGDGQGATAGQAGGLGEEADGERFGGACV